MSRSVLEADAVRQVRWRPVQALWLWGIGFVMMWHSGTNVAFCVPFYQLASKTRQVSLAPVPQPYRDGGLRTGCIQAN